MEQTEIEEPNEHRYLATKLWCPDYRCCSSFHPGKAVRAPAPAAPQPLCFQLWPPPLKTLGWSSGHKLLSAMYIRTDVPTFRWRQTVLNLLGGSSSSGISGGLKRHRQDPESRELQAAKTKMWLRAGKGPSLLARHLMHVWPLGYSMAATERKTSQILFFPSPRQL